MENIILIGSLCFIGGIFATCLIIYGGIMYATRDDSDDDDWN